MPASRFLIRQKEERRKLTLAFSAPLSYNNIASGVVKIHTGGKASEGR